MRTLSSKAWELDQANRSADSSTQTILSVLKTYPSNEVAILGCHAARISRHSCEYDLLVASRDATPPKYSRVGDSYAEIFFRSEKELRDPDPEFGASLARATVLRDNALLLASSMANSKRRFKQNCAKAAETHLAAALKALGRVDEMVESHPPDADFWLVSAAVDLAVSEVFSSQQLPAPSHLLTQMKGLSKRKSASFKEWSEASGLGLASRTSCENRLEAIAILHDVLKTTSMDTKMALKFGRYRSDDAVAIVRQKAGELLASRDTVECFSFLGVEAVRTVLDLHAVHCHSLGKKPDYANVTSELASGPDRLISQELLRGLGLTRHPGLVKPGANALRAAVSSLATNM